MSKLSPLKRCSAKHKQDVVLHLLRGESLDELSWEIDQPPFSGYVNPLNV